MTFLEMLEDVRGCTLVHLDAGSGLAVFWNGSAAFVEYHVHERGVTQGDAWTAPRRLQSAQDAVAEAIARYGL